MPNVTIGPAEGARRPRLQRELFVSFGLLAAAALSLAVGTALIAQLLRPEYAAVALVLLIAADVAVLVLFGTHLVERSVLRPLRALTAAADELAAGNLAVRVPPADTIEFTDVADRFNHMTERLVDAQDQLIRAEKLASVGHLAAGLAHEIGNPLSAITTYMDLLRKRGADAALLQDLEREISRIDRIIRSLLSYARPTDEPTGRVDVGAIASGVLDMLERQGVLKGVTVTTEIAPALPPVRAKAHLLEQALVNLVLNAVDAADGGSVGVGVAPWRYRTRPDLQERRSGSIAAPEVEAPFHRAGTTARRPWRPELPDGTPGVLAWVTDSGGGVPAEDRERVFEPFYTTKEPGAGTGLGLAVVQRVVHDAGGAVWVDAAREGGAAFKIFLPASDEA